MSNYYHIVAPNDSSCMNDGLVQESLFSAVSMHAGGVNVLFGDSHHAQSIDRIAVRPNSTTKFVVQVAAPDSSSTPTGGIVSLLQNTATGGLLSLQSGTFLYTRVSSRVYEARFSLEVPDFSGEALLQLRDHRKSLAEIWVEKTTDHAATEASGQ